MGAKIAFGINWPKRAISP